ncbi:MAG: helix-turn-helix transcriptional regulator [Pseudonocardiales bacterium]|nr:helix-turn-helix transcriptional regulator [Pseudonocardiales bacterium]
MPVSCQTLHPRSTHAPAAGGGADLRGFRVARLAAQALSNRDIAQALFITTKTVSDHLSSTYRKLNINTRDQLATAMAAHAQPGSP